NSVPKASAFSRQAGRRAIRRVPLQQTVRTNQTRKRSRPSGRLVDLYGEFDPGSGRTLAARLTHASRARTRGGVTLLGGERRTGEYHVGNLPQTLGEPRETGANPGYS